MEIGRFKKIIIGVVCLCMAFAGFRGAGYKMSGKAAENELRDISAALDKDFSRAAMTDDEQGSARSNSERYVSALEALWTLDQSELSEEELIAIAREAAAMKSAEMAMQELSAETQSGQVMTFAASGDFAVTALAYSEEGEPEVNEYANLAIADVRNYVNVRSLPSTDGQILGKVYNGAVAEIIETAGENDEWFHVTSGSVEGYIKAEYFIYGDAAADVIDNYVTRTVRVNANCLNVRKAADIDAKRAGHLFQGEIVPYVEKCGDWIKIQYADSDDCYVAAEFVTIIEEFTYAKSIEEERAEEAARREQQRAQQERQKVSEENAPLENIEVVPPNTTYSTNEELRSEIVNYAMQYLGNRYVMGGNSLVTGTDCSGFTSLIYKEFGYSISRTPSGQLSSAGRGIDYSEIQPGDIICYSSNGGKSCTHVAIYIGDGQIIHSANSRKGVVIYNAGYDRIVGVRNVID